MENSRQIKKAYPWLRNVFTQICSTFQALFEKYINLKMIENIEHKGLKLAIIIRSGYIKEGIEFFTDDQDPLQIGYMNRNKDYIIPPHRHNAVARTIQFTHEVLFIKTGKVRVDFYDNVQLYLKSCVLEQGDVILLADGGHGFKMLESSEIIEVKQGPFVGKMDKVRFEPTDDTKISY